MGRLIDSASLGVIIFFYSTDFRRFDWSSEEFSQIQPIKTAEIKRNQFGKKKGKTLHPVVTSNFQRLYKKTEGWYQKSDTGKIIF